MRELERAGIDAGKLLDAYENHYRDSYSCRRVSGKVCWRSLTRKLELVNKRRQEFFGK